ncbi:hypothetical protein MNBD_GAMMA11-3224 [hydrothermal vent metagenome]|uniref:DUF5666 domain-containing protein n=1 Tax=hydrothermal vent metagenome TaxID=652676 RepID=A0A3B0XPS9_9ZZZZ
MMSLENDRDGVSLDKVLIMKILNKLFLIMCVSGAALLFSQQVQAETGLHAYANMSKTIASLDKKKQWIELSETQFAYDSSTIITDYKGRPVTADALKKGVLITIKLDASQKYIGRPLLSEIHIESFGYE